MATAVADVLPELLELDKISACFDNGDLSALDGLLPAECLGLVDDLTCALVSDLPNDPDQTPLAPSTPPKATHAAAAFPDSSASASPPNERSDASEEPQHVRTVSLLSTRVATQLAQRAVATAPARGGSVSSSLGAGCGAPGDAAACSTQETQEYLLVRLDAHGRVQRQATHADMVLLSDLLQQPCPCESAEAASSGTAPACNRKPGGPCCHCGVTGAIVRCAVLARGAAQLLLGVVCLDE